MSLRRRQPRASHADLEDPGGAVVEADLADRLRGEPAFRADPGGPEGGFGQARAGGAPQPAQRHPYQKTATTTLSTASPPRRASFSGLPGRREEAAASGVYLVRMQAGSFTRVRTAVLVR